MQGNYWATTHSSTNDQSGILGTKNICKSVAKSHYSNQTGKADQKDRCQKRVQSTATRKAKRIVQGIKEVIKKMNLDTMGLSDQI